MTFDEIEQVIGSRLPQKSKGIRAWWSNNPDNNVMTRAWLAAGFETAQVDIAGERLTFVPANRNAKGLEEMSQAKFSHTEQQSADPAKKPGRHPAWGLWKGRVTLVPGVDYTQPADPDWGKVYED